MAPRRSSGTRPIRKVVVCLRKGRPGNGGVAMVLKEILRECGVRRMSLLGSPRRMPSMTGYGLEITGYLSQ